MSKYLKWLLQGLAVGFGPAVISIVYAMPYWPTFAVMAWSIAVVLYFEEKEPKS